MSELCWHKVLQTLCCAELTMVGPASRGEEWAWGTFWARWCAWMRLEDGSLHATIDQRWLKCSNWGHRLKHQHQESNIIFFLSIHWRSTKLSWKRMTSPLTSSTIIRNVSAVPWIFLSQQKLGMIERLIRRRDQVMGWTWACSLTSQISDIDRYFWWENILEFQPI